MELENILKKLDKLNSKDVSTLNSDTQHIISVDSRENFTLITRAINANASVYKKISTYIKEQGINKTHFVYSRTIPADSKAVEHKQIGLEYNQAEVQIKLYVFKGK